MKNKIITFAVVIILVFFTQYVSAIDLEDCTTIPTQGTYYLIQDIYSTPNDPKCFQITSDNVILDCGGHTIHGDGKKNSIGIYSNKDNTTIKNCIVENWDIGIKFHSANMGAIVNNTIRSNKEYGIYLTHNSDNNVIMNNRIYENEKGMYLTLACDSNIIFNNYFSDNYKNVEALGENFWNITNHTGTNIIGGSNIGGNYFSDYTGTDNNGDGFGESPYYISFGSNKDNLPLAIPEVPTIFLSIGVMFLSLLRMKK